MTVNTDNKGLGLEVRGPLGETIWDVRQTKGTVETFKCIMRGLDVNKM